MRRWQDVAKAAKPPAGRDEGNRTARKPDNQAGRQPDPRLVKLVRALARQAAEEDFTEACRQAARRRGRK